MGDTEKKSVAEIVIENFLKDVKEKQSMPWQRPYRRYNAFNWYSLTPYRGINRLILENGEYLTMNQINTYNKKHRTSFRGPSDMDMWQVVVFYKVDVKYVSEDEWSNVSSVEYADFIASKEHLKTMMWLYYGAGDHIEKKRNVLRYSRVIERSLVVDKDGNVLPSRFDQGVVTLSLSKPDEISKDYIDREGLRVVETIDIPSYTLYDDTVHMSKLFSSEGAYWSTFFHELAHSTGALNRNARDFFKKVVDGTPLKKDEVDDLRAKEECIAEITASMLCAECGISDFETSGTKVHDNNIAYVQSWSRKIKDWGSGFIYLVSESERAYNRIMSITD